jgi:excisionase family DNA binding protein
MIKFNDAVRIQQCVDSIADSVKSLAILCNTFNDEIKKILPAESEGKIDRLMRVDAVAELLSCSRPMVYKLIYNGELKAVKIGKRGIRIKEASINNFLAENTVLPSDIYKDGENVDDLHKGDIIIIPLESINYNELAGEEFVIASTCIKGVYAKKWDEPGKGFFIPHGEFVLNRDVDVAIHGG